MLRLQLRLIAVVMAALTMLSGCSFLQRIVAGEGGGGPQPQTTVTVTPTVATPTEIPTTPGGSGSLPPLKVPATIEAAPGESTPGWSANLDPTSVYGLHKAQNLEPIVKPEVHPLTVAEAASITGLTIKNRDACLAEVQNPPTCQFTITFSTLPAGVVVGTVLNAGVTQKTPHGLLVKVTAVRGTAVDAVQARLQDALQQGEFRVEKAFTVDDIVGDVKLSPGVTYGKVTPGVLRGGQSGPGPLPRSMLEASLKAPLSLDVEPVDGVKVSGSLDFGVGCGIDGGANASDLVWLELSCKAWQAASIKVSSTKDTFASNNRYPLAIIPIAVIPIPVGGLLVVVVTVTIEVTVDLNGAVNVNLSYEGQEKATVSTGFRASLLKGLDHTGAISANGSSGGVAALKDATVVAVGRAEVKAALYGVLGITAGAELTVRLTATPRNDPAWRITANAAIFAGVFLGALGYELRAVVRYHLKGEFEIGRQAGGARVSISSPYNAKYPAGKGLILRAAGFDSSGQPTLVVWRDENDKVLGSGVDSDVVVYLPIGSHRLTATITDATGKKVSSVATPIIETPDLSVTLSATRLDGASLTGNVTVGTPFLVTGAISSSLPQPPTCAAIIWTATNATVATDSTCTAKVTATAAGAVEVKATVKDSYGTTRTSTLPVTASPKPAVAAPQFEGITVTDQDGKVITASSFFVGRAVNFSVKYLNYGESTVVPVYTWSANYELQTPSPDTVTSSTRSYTAGFTQVRVSILCIISDKATGNVITTRLKTISVARIPQ
jgi:hypothetical protein